MCFYLIAQFMAGTITQWLHSLLGNGYFQITIRLVDIVEKNPTRGEKAFSLCVLLEEVVVSDKRVHSGTADSSYCT